MQALTKQRTKTTIRIAGVVLLVLGLVLGLAGCPPKPAAEIPPAENLVVPPMFLRPAVPLRLGDGVASGLADAGPDAGPREDLASPLDAGAVPEGAGAGLSPGQ